MSWWSRRTGTSSVRPSVTTATTPPGELDLLNRIWERALNNLLADDSSSGRHLLVPTDARGEILWRVGSPEMLWRSDRLEFADGADWSEAERPTAGPP